MKKIISYPAVVRDWLLKSNRSLIDTQEVNQHRPTYFFLFCVISYCLYLLAMQPDWVLSGEMWAESGTNYFPNASSPSFAVRFFSTDAGYIPLPQRILAYIGHLLQLPARSVPYFYTWSAILLTGVMMGAFCLKPFRALIKSDVLRLFVAIAVLLIVDFETRTFINFTYLATFFVGIVAALAFVERSSDVPKWAWSVPLLMISKPAVLSALPAVIVAATVSKTRFKLIALAATLTGLAQIVQMKIIYPHSFFLFHKYSGLEKIFASFEYFFGFMGTLFLGKAVPVESHRPLWFMMIGAGFLSLCIYTILKKRTNTSAIILTGLSLMYFNILLNAFALSAQWNIDYVKPLLTESLNRHDIAVYYGLVLVVAGLIAAFFETEMVRSSWRIAFGPTIFLAWFFYSGWFAASGSFNRTPGFPVINNSQWQTMADIIDSGRPVCVPVDPIDMMLERNCKQLNALVGGLFWPKELITFENLLSETGHSEMTLEPPPSTLGHNLISLAVMVKPQTAQQTSLMAEATLKLKDGTVKYLAGMRRLPKSGGLVMLIGKEVIPVNEIQTVNFQFSAPVELGYSAAWRGAEHSPVVFWMGN